MTDIKSAFQNGKAFIPFVTAGDPDLETTEKLLIEMSKNGADIIEIGIPFSDPIAEGVVIQEADLRSLSAGTTTDKIFDMVKRIRPQIDAVLAADARIDTPQQRRRDEPERNAAHVDRCHEARDVGHDAPTDPQQEGRAVGAAADQLAADLLDGLQRLVLLARLHADRVAALEQFGTETGDIAVRQHDHPPLRQQARQLLDSAPHHDAAASGHLQRITHH